MLLPQEFPCGPVVRTQCFHCPGLGSIPGQGNKIPNATRCSSQIKINKIKNKQKTRRTTILQPVEQKPHSQKDRQDEKAEGYVPDEGTR